MQLRASIFGLLSAIVLSFLNTRSVSAQEQSAIPQSARAEFKDLIKRLQDAPDNNDLREKIIKLALAMKPKPAIPEEARRYFVHGNSAFKDATGPDDYDRAIEQYRQASILAPWWTDVYFNEAKSLEARKRYDEAARMLKLSLDADPDSENASAEQDLIYELEDKNEKWKASPVKKEEEFADKKKKAQELVDALNNQWPDLIKVGFCQVSTRSGYRNCTEDEANGKNWEWFSKDTGKARFTLVADGESIFVKWGFPIGGDDYYAPIDDQIGAGVSKVDATRLNWIYAFRCAGTHSESEIIRKCKTWPEHLDFQRSTDGHRMLFTARCYNNGANNCSRGGYVFSDAQ